MVVVDGVVIVEGGRENSSSCREFTKDGSCGLIGAIPAVSVYGFEYSCPVSVVDSGL